MIDENKIKKLHQNNLYGRFVENGGPCLAAEILKIEGASKTVYSSYIPYSKELGNKSKLRAVSLENMWEWIKELAQKPAPVNFDFVSFFQISEKSTHGYIGIRKYGEFPKIYHLTLNGKYSRIDAINAINNNSLKLLNDETEENIVDGVWTFPATIYKSNTIWEYYDKFQDLKETLRYISLCKNYDSACYISSDGNILRVEDFVRLGKEITIYKGSFNPIHNAHIEILERFEKPSCFSISTNTFDKGQCDIDNLLFRIQLINKCGYGVLIYNQPAFYDMIRLIKGKMNDDQILLFPLGGDTYNRMLRDYGGNIESIEKLPVQFHTFERKGFQGGRMAKLPSNVKIHTFNKDISSSEIKSEMKLGNFENVKNQFPKEIWNDVKDYYK